MAEDLIRYDIVIQDALRGAVRKILAEVSRIGLPGEHHFYIAFDTNAPGVRISPRLKERYPKEMTVVLQHQFWDLTVTDHAFEVGLSFGGIPEKLFVPFSAIKGFFDPSVQFALEFEPGKTAEELPEDLVEAAQAHEQAEAQLAEIERSMGDPTGTDAAKPAPRADEKSAGAKQDGAPDADADESAGADVVSLDAFRKKT
ncbi:SspB family protein [Stappia sp.]|uniref:SspB family protein n=1 Tax=Stappia sp. TaxID=1870903 RepID=UPI0032D8F1B0